MKRQLLTGNAAAAWGARLADVDYVPAFPITPQTEIIETLAGWFNNGVMQGRLVTLESEHSMLTAAAAAAATGVRVFTATSSQGLLYAMEMLYTVSGWRAPFVMVNVARGLASPLTLESDHNDILAARDCGFLQIHCATGQEVLDSVLMAYRLAEDERVRLPVIVNMDGFYLSFTREPVELPDAEAVRAFLPAFDPENVRFRASKPISQAVAVLGGSPYSYFRYETHLAALEALGVYDRIEREFAGQFGRHHPAVDCYRADDFFRETPKLVEAGRLFLALPPLYRLTQGGETAYARDDAHKEQLLKTVFKAAKGKVELSRFKGLGEMPSKQLRDTTMDPKLRTLLRVTLPDQTERGDYKKTVKLVESLMGRKPELRFDFIQKNAKFVRDLDV